jgi:hypothetical protein
MRVTLKMVNEKLAQLGASAELAKGVGYFLFRGGEADDWIDRTVAVPTIGSLALEQWLNEYKRLKTLNAQMLKTAKHERAKPANTESERPTTTAPSASTLNEPIRAAVPHHSSARHAQNQAKRIKATPIQANATPVHEALRGEPSHRDSATTEACGLKAKLLADVEDARNALLNIEDQEVNAAREGRVADLVTLSAAATKQRGIFDRALLAIRDHALRHGCFANQKATDIPS